MHFPGVHQKRLTRALRVWGWYLPGTGTDKRCIVAAKSKREAAALHGGSYYEFCRWAAETGNAEELRVARAAPGVVHARDSTGLVDSGPWRTVPRRFG